MARNCEKKWVIDAPTANKRFNSVGPSNWRFFSRRVAIFCLLNVPPSTRSSGSVNVKYGDQLVTESVKLTEKIRHSSGKYLLCYRNTRNAFPIAIYCLCYKSFSLQLC